MKRILEFSLLSAFCMSLACKPNSPVEWSKSNSLVKDNIQVEIQNITVFTLDGGIIIDLNVKNLSDTKKINFSTWNGKDLGQKRDWATLTDNFGNEYKRKNPSSWVDSIYPASTKTDRLEFEPPVKNIQWLHLELPAENFESSGMIRFEISQTKVKQPPK